MAKVKGAFLLILAVAVVLLGVTFINNAFKNIKAKTTEVMDVTEEVLMPTLEDPLKLEFTKKDMDIGGRADLTISFMNPNSIEKNCQLSVYDDGGFLEPNNWIVYNHNPTSRIKPEQIIVWQAGIEDIEQIKQTKILTVKVCCADSYEEDVSCSSDLYDGVEFRDSFVLNIG